MAIIVANIPLALSVPAGFRLQFGSPVSGTASVTLPGRVLNETLTDGEGMGPWQSDASVTVTSTVNSTCWTIRNIGSSAATFEDIHLSQTPYCPGVFAEVRNATSGEIYPATWTGSIYTVALRGLIFRAWQRSEAVVKPIGSSSNNAFAFNQTVGLSTDDRCITVKSEMEGHFVAVKYVMTNRAANAINNTTAVVGVTETNAIDTSANIGTPVIGGVAYPQLAPAGTINGWRAPLWGGGSAVNVASASAAQQFQPGDWTNIGSVERADGGVRPLLLQRFWRPGAASGNWSFNTCGASARTPSAAMRQRTYIVSQAFSDGVSALNTPMSLSTAVLPAFPIVRFAVPVMSVWGIGDSTMQCNAQAPEGLSSWGMRACAEVSTMENPVIWANFGASSQNGQTAWGIAKSALAAGCPAPSVFLIEAASVNDPSPTSSPTVRDREAQIGRALDVIATARQYGVQYIIFVPLMPFNSLTLAFDDIRKGTNAEIVAIARASGVWWLDFSALGTGASPDRWISAYNDGLGAAGDGIHPDETAFDDVMTPRLVTLLRIITG